MSCPRIPIEPGFVYFIVAHDGPKARFIKIGYTANGKIAARMMAIQGGCPLPLVCYGSIGGSFGTERRLHWAMTKLRAPGGGEWFCVDEELEKILNNHRSNPNGCAAQIVEYVREQGKKLHKSHFPI